MVEPRPGGGELGALENPPYMVSRDALTGLFSHTSLQLALRERMKVADRTVCLAHYREA